MHKVTYDQKNHQKGFAGWLAGWFGFEWGFGFFFFVKIVMQLIDT